MITKNQKLFTELIIKKINNIVKKLNQEGKNLNLDKSEIKLTLLTAFIILGKKAAETKKLKLEEWL